MINTRIELADQIVQKRLQQLERSGANMLPVFRSIARYGKSSTQLRFRTQTSVHGNRWKASQRAKNEGGMTGSDSRRLRNSITYQATRDSAVWGTNVVYAAAFHFGKKGIEKVPEHRVAAHTRRITVAFGSRLSRPRRISISEFTKKAHKRQTKQVARPFLGLSREDRKVIMKMLSDHLGSGKAG
jgi:phage gpG-like protein